MTKRGRALVSCGAIGTAISILWFVSFYSKVDLREFGQGRYPLQCLFFSSGICSAGSFIALFNGSIPYHPFFLWLSLATGGFGLIISISNDQPSQLVAEHSGITSERQTYADTTIPKTEIVRRDIPQGEPPTSDSLRVRLAETRLGQEVTRLAARKGYRLDLNHPDVIILIKAATPYRLFNIDDLENWKQRLDHEPDIHTL